MHWSPSPLKTASSSGTRDQEIPSGEVHTAASEPDLSNPTATRPLYGYAHHHLDTISAKDGLVVRDTGPQDPIGRGLHTTFWSAASALKSRLTRSRIGSAALSGRVKPLRLRFGALLCRPWRTIEETTVFTDAPTHLRSDLEQILDQVSHTLGDP